MGPLNKGLFQGPSAAWALLGPWCYLWNDKLSTPRPLRLEFVGGYGHGLAVHGVGFGSELGDLEPLEFGRYGQSPPLAWVLFH
jgi:hypothetical protein